ncbi:MAG TPA: choice-of-anchor D domain-containing protein [Terriglobia bacterium]|nr:choice-of-anchor D domain-containing protein [Terriglobia bacterium]
MGINPTVLPSSLSFGGQIVGTTSTAQMVTLANPGQASLTISSIAVSGDFSETNNCGGALTAGANCTIAVSFKPTAGGNRTGSVSVTDSASGSPQTVGLSGSGEDFTLGVASGGSGSASVAPGQTAEYSLSMMALGGFNQSVSFTCTGAPAGASCSISPASATPGAGSATALTVSVSTTAPSQIEKWRGLGSKDHSPPGGLGLAVFILLSFLTFAVRRCRWRTRLAVGACVLVVIGWAGCGGGGAGSTGQTANSGPPSGTYTLTVTGSAGASSATLSHSVTLQFVVT